MTPLPVSQEAREDIARIIDPHGFRQWQSLYEYCIGQKDPETEARGTADWAHGQQKAEALAKADAIIARFESTIREQCAKVAEGKLYNPPADDFDASWNDACVFIATAIREGSAA
ncbi:MAG: hypothetical protein EON59_03855 [Alphaproteobacteria bacterium]|nr:MAG: hypothetical protein EON59_03855 [Alphaproteobacteria bacterium]